MAFIANKMPNALTSTGRQLKKIVVKLRTPPPASASTAEFAAHSGVAALNAIVPGGTIRPYFENPNSLFAEARPDGAGVSPANLLRNAHAYLAVRVPAGMDAKEIARMLRAHSEVELAYIEGGQVPPPAVTQGYLGAAPVGVDAQWSWTAAKGAGVGFVDLESGWTLNHEALAPANVSIISGVNKNYFGHGTAVLGEVIAAVNNYGVVGIAADVTTRVVSPCMLGDDYRISEAILNAVKVMQPGDILQLEAQTTYPTVDNVYLPVEVESLIFDAIQTATSQGIIVVECAGNGNNQPNGGFGLDQFKDELAREVLNRRSPDFRDSGAIMVGAAAAAAPHAKLGFSNFGSRVDCFAWGEQIATCGDGWEGNLTNSYTSEFDGTSGATPIVTGAAILLQSWGKQRGYLYTPKEMRDLLSNAVANTASADTANELIGVMPNLKALIQQEELRLGAAA